MQPSLGATSNVAVGTGGSGIWFLAVPYCSQTSYGVSELAQAGEMLLVLLVLQRGLAVLVFPSCPHQVITLEGWVDIMYFVMDAHSFYNFIYFILLIIVSGLAGTGGSPGVVEGVEWLRGAGG